MARAARGCRGRRSCGRGARTSTSATADVAADEFFRAHAAETPLGLRVARRRVSESSWRVDLAPAASRQLRKLPPDVTARARGPILALARDPRPPGSRAPVGSRFWRLRAGDLTGRVPDRRRGTVDRRPSRRASEREHVPSGAVAAHTDRREARPCCRPRRSSLGGRTAAESAPGVVRRLGSRSARSTPRRAACPSPGASSCQKGCRATRPRPARASTNRRPGRRAAA